MMPGDLLVIFSDGISEALNAAGEEFGDDRILGVPSACRRGASRRCWTAWCRRSATFAAGTVQSDDMTAVVVRYGVGL